MVRKVFSPKIPENVKLTVLGKWKDILRKCKDYIGNQPKPAKLNYFDKSKDNFVYFKSIPEI